MSMSEDIRQQVLSRIEADYGLKHRSGTHYMRGGRCPSCDKKELYTNHDAPWVLRCGRESKCGKELHVKDLYPDLFDDWSKRFQHTPKSPNAAADGYLQFGRGFSLAPLKGLYTQDNYYSREKNAGTATVRFSLKKGGWWERLIDRPHRFGKMKARFQPGQSYAGVWWSAPCVDAQLETAGEVWIVEGIFDAIALMEHGLCAVAALSSNAYPEESLAALAKLRGGRLPTLVWALDNEPGAHAYTRQHAARAEKMGYRCTAAQIPQLTGRKVDWNDLHLRALALADAEERQAMWTAALDEARHQGALLLAKTALDKGLLMYRRSQRREFYLGHQQRLWWFSFDEGAYRKLLADHLKAQGIAPDELEPEDEEKLMRTAAKVSQTANCYPEALYFQRNEITDESWYYFRIDFPRERPSAKGTFTASQTLNAATFRDRLASIAAGAVFDGNQNQLMSMMKDQLDNIKSVEAVDFIGYSRQHQAYLLGDIAIRHGELMEVNAEDYFTFDKLRLKTTQKSIRLDIQRDPEANRSEWLGWLWTCFGPHGIVALAFFFGSLFAEQIREQYKSFPFLEATGEAGAGKTTLLTFLWKLLGRSDYEGFDPAKSSRAGRARAMGQISNMPVVLLEADRTTPDKPHAKSFEWDELKDFYGGGTLATRGVRNGGNETYEPPFRGSIVISQNMAVNASEAIITRIVKLHFKRPEASSESRAAADNLNALQVEEVSHFLLQALRAESKVLETLATQYRYFEGYMREAGEIRLERVIKNHAQMLALVDCLKLVVPLTPEMIGQTRIALLKMAAERQRAVSADHPQVAEFWEVFDYLETTRDEGPVVNHSREPARTIAINLNDFYARAQAHGQKLADLPVLRELLRDSRRHKFRVANHPVNSAILARRGPGHSTTIKCWVFERGQ